LEKELDSLKEQFLEKEKVSKQLHDQLEILQASKQEREVEEKRFSQLEKEYFDL
jgi:hypothetical protein